MMNKNIYIKISSTSNKTDKKGKKYKVYKGSAILIRPEKNGYMTEEGSVSGDPFTMASYHIYASRFLPQEEYEDYLDYLSRANYTLIEEPQETTDTATA